MQGASGQGRPSFPCVAPVFFAAFGCNIPPMSLSIRLSLSRTGAMIYRPTGRAVRGGVVCLHGSEGGFAGWNDWNCALLAAEGFCALAHNYSPTSDLFRLPDIDDRPLEGAADSLAALRTELSGFGCGIGLFGGSRGAEHAMLLADLLAEEARAECPDALALHSPPDAAWPAFIVADFQTGKPWDGDRARPAWSWRGTHERTKPGTLLGNGSYVRPVFIAQGDADTVWGDEGARRLAERLTSVGYPPEAHFFAGEGHIFSTTARNREWELLVDFFARALSPKDKAPEVKDGLVRSPE
jgi:pimeloyl-ACP methyl ester carboxylesterase